MALHDLEVEPVDSESDDLGVEEDQGDVNIRDEIDPSVEEEDAVMIQQIFDQSELEKDDMRYIHSLTHEDINLGQFSIAKEAG